MRHAFCKILLTSVFLFAVQSAVAEVQADSATPGSIYSLSAVLMDGDSGRVLYEKEGEKPRPNASTTKVMTCILALENADGDDYVKVSANAAAQPDVQLNLREGEQYYMEDLLHSLMLMSHNDTAVAIAEHIGGTTEGFAEMMNKKADEIGCTDTYFITPNGLDAKDEKGVHHTTARDLALIMRYAVQSETFLRITETMEYAFSDISGARRFELRNTNALLNMTDGVLSGKTGFTGDAGYCYVCACRCDGKTFVIALLGCGWPNNKEYKWKDTLKLLEYGNENYSYKSFWKEPEIPFLTVEEGTDKNAAFGEKVKLQGILKVPEKEKNKKLLLKKGEQLSYRLQMKEELQAPVKKGTEIGRYICGLDGEILGSYPVVADRDISKITYQWCVERIFHEFFH